ncbi:alpha/beta fold hydrolase [Alicyclobacillus fastidiosus]|uniref:Alpha/beta hydrolase n=1 Tax=Alicyclobacillus fastidiosus TaxID=392011 RepID=A0ABV5AC26_9BACL|nr:alpha/beta hydrolase [Alicyclobacillus fastidiosus]WEH11473.1 alpha/beta hydrolase [Alicyclobacillus fastidiosus]
MQGKFVMVGNIKTHYLQCGSGERSLILLHSGEHGASAENSFEYNIEPLSRSFHVYAIDMVGFGQTDKLFDFGNVRSFRMNHIRDFMTCLCIEKASFIGCSTGGGLVLEVASMDSSIWNVEKIVTVSGGGPNNQDVHNVLNQ